MCVSDLCSYTCKSVYLVFVCSFREHVVVQEGGFTLGDALDKYQITLKFLCVLCVQQIKEDSESQVTAALIYCQLSLLHRCC